MKYLIYVSSAYRLLNQDELLEILVVSRENNLSNNITGMLLYGEGTFIQVLEGDAIAVDQIYNAITADSRHKNIILITSGETIKRNFPNWSMGFKSINAQELTEIKGYVDPSNKRFLNEEQGNAIITMMKAFADANRMVN
jgi:hypothetical protein